MKEKRFQEFLNRGLGIIVLLILFTSLQLHAQSNITGRVTAENGSPVAGATVTVKGTRNATTTGPDGSFSLSAAADAELIISSVGYSEVEVRASGGEANVQLKENTRLLSDVVVVGYGTQKRRSVTGAISSVSTKELTAMPLPDPRQALQGRVPGIVVVNNGSPGEAPIVRIRGIGSINYASDPFYVVDGFPGADMTMIDSRDIQSLEVLRDASSAAIYGSRAANGVVIVTTKKGSRVNGTKVNLESYYGFQGPWKKLDLLNTEEYIKYATALLQNANSALPPRFSKLDDPIYPGATQTYRQTNTDWQDEMFRTAPISHTTVSISTGGEKSRFYTSGGYAAQEGIMLGTKYERFNFRFNSDHDLGKFITFGQTFTIATDSRLNENNAGGRTQLKHIIHNIPYIPVKDPSLPGGYRGPSNDDASDPQNPVRIALQDLSRNNTVRVLGLAYLQANLFSGLNYRFTAGINHINGLSRFNGPIYNESFNARNLNRVEQAQSYFRSIYLSNQLNYNKTFGNHTIGLTAVAEKQTGLSRFVFGGASYTNNDLREITSFGESPGLNGGLNEDVLYSYIGRINYEYGEKYILSASYRRDGSSVWAPGNKWANFPSVSAGWRISNEKFFTIDAISELKLRGSWGKMGFNGIGNYAWQTTLQQNGSPILGGEMQPGAFVNKIGNEDLEWEITDMSNIGLDLGLWNNKLLIQAEYFKRRSDNLILNIPLSPSLGFSQPTPGNVASMENTGLEFQVTYAKRTGSFTYDAAGNISFLKNRVLTFGEQATGPIYAGSNADFGGFDITRTAPGEAVQSFYGWKVDGIFQSQAEIDSYDSKDGDAATKYQDKAAPGDIRFKDLNNDGTINGDDRMILGTFIPKFSYGINLTANYKNFDATMFLQGVQGNKVYNGTKVLTQGMLRLFGAGKDVLNAWTPQNTNTDIPRAVSGDPNNNSRTSDRFLEDGSYLRVKVFSIGYTIPQSTLSRVGGGAIGSLRVFISSLNLLTFTKYTGYDPEIGSRFGAALTSGIDYGQFPQPRSVLFGLQLGFK
jgi:TonB-linked SusC/RagA family outer membrane protein